MKVEIRIITPVVINTGKVYDFCEVYPYCSKITNEKRLYQLNVDKAISLSDANTVERAIQIATKAFSVYNAQNKNSQLKSARELLCSCVYQSEYRKQVVVRPLKVAASEKNPMGQVDLYREISEKPALVINRIADNPQNGLPYIPGSSIKGALRTGVLENRRAESKLNPHNGNKTRDFEANIYGKEYFTVQDDPFKYLKVSDFHFDDFKTPTYLVSAPNNAFSAATACEFYQGKTVVATGDIAFDNRFSVAKNLVEVLESSSEFFYNNYQSELYNDFNRTEVGRQIEKLVYDGKKAGCYLLRVGHYSGIQNCTFNVDNPDMRKQEMNVNGGNLVLLNNEVPAGICLIKICE